MTCHMAHALYESIPTKADHTRFRLGSDLLITQGIRRELPVSAGQTRKQAGDKSLP